MGATFDWLFSGLLAYYRSTKTNFDIGAIALPFQHGFAPIPKRSTRWLSGLAGLVAFPFGGGALWMTFAHSPFEEFSFDDIVVSLIFLVIGLVFVVVGFMLLVAFIFGGRRQLTIRIDPDWVEVDDRPPLGRRLNWREPLSNYTGVRCHSIELELGREFGSSLLWSNLPYVSAIGAIDLDHPETDRIIPLFRTTNEDKGEVERRWQAFADALGKPMTGSLPSEIGDYL